MASLDVRFVEGDRFVVGVRGHTITVDQPEAGDAGPTPTELFVAGLAACVGFYAERFMRRHDIAPAGLAVECEYTLEKGPPARVSRIDLRVVLPAGFPSSRREALQRIVDHCTVHNSIRWAPAVRTTIRRRDEAA